MAISSAAEPHHQNASERIRTPAAAWLAAAVRVGDELTTLAKFATGRVDIDLAAVARAQERRPEQRPNEKEYNETAH